ncbi:MAG: MFS transporter [Deltaproteobacteria bacterium]|nr:MFS transporter [Deltaproteobacteria bacterium]
MAFFFSGASSLIFQAIWSRLLVHVFGATGFAISTVVTAFMAGLGLGAWVGGRYADRIKHSILTYAAVEALVGVWALMLPYMISPEGWLADVNGQLRVTMGDNAIGLFLGRFLCVMPILLVPTTLMGSSLPLLARHFVRRDQASGEVGSWVGALYSVNTLGAVAGVGLASFFLMPTYGVHITNLVAVVMNLCLGATIFLARRPLLGATWKPGEKLQWLPKRAPKGAPPETESEDQSEEPADSEQASSVPDPRDDLARPIPEVARRAAFVAFAVSGMAALFYEVVWTRSLAMVIGSSVYSFGLILEGFLIGIAGGSAFAAAAIGRSKGVLPATAFASGVLVLLGNSVFGIQDSLQTWALVSVVCIAPIVVIWAATRGGVAEGRFGARGPIAPAMLMLAVPLADAAVVAITGEGQLAYIVASVIVCITLLLAVLLLLRRYPVLQLALVQLLIGAAAFLNYVYQDDVPCAFASTVTGMTDMQHHIPLVQFFMFLISFLCVVPATLGMGAMFPLTLRIWTRGGGSVGRDVGNVYAGNTIGSIFGAWLPGFVLMPIIGMERTLHWGVVLNLVMALVLLITSAAETPAEKKGGDGDGKKPDALPGWYSATVYVLAPLIPAILAAGYFFTRAPDSPLRWNLSQMTLGVFRVSLASDACSPSWGDPDLVYYHDGLSTTVTVERWGRHYALKNNGKVDASNGDDMPTQVMVAGYPLLMHDGGPEGADVAIIGFGSGVTVGTALKFPVASVDVIELERSVPEAAKFFQSVNHLDYRLTEFPFVQMPRLRVINDDGRNYLASTRKQYDVIMSEPSNPWITGVSDLFTTDHFRITKQRLKPGGIYCQWVQLYELSPENIKSIFRTFASQFRYVVVFAAEDLSSDTVMLGSDSPLPLDLSRVSTAFALPGVKDALERAYIHSPEDLLARTLLANRDEVMEYTRIERRMRGGVWVDYPDSNNDPNRGCTGDCERVPAPLNTDDNMHIEFAAPRDLIGFERYEGYLSTIYSPDWPYGRLLANVSGFGEGREGAENYARMALSLIAAGRKAEAAQFIHHSQDMGGGRLTLVAAEVITLLMTADGEPRIAIEPPVPGPQLAPREARQLSQGFDEVRAAVDTQSYGAALSAMEEIPTPLRLHSGPALRFLYGYLLYKTSDAYPSRNREAIEQLEDLIRTDPEYVRRHPELHYFLARAHDADLNFDKALRNMRVYVETADLPEITGEDHEAAPTTDAPGEADKAEHDGETDPAPELESAPQDASGAASTEPPTPPSADAGA